MSSQSLQTSGTHHSKLKGALTKRTSYPTDSGPEGLHAGDMFYNSGNTSVVVRTSSQWRLKNMTTTSTTTS